MWMDPPDVRSRGERALETCILQGLRVSRTVRAADRQLWCIGRDRGVSYACREFILRIPESEGRMNDVCLEDARL
jgi:hypothetical protein